MNLPCPKCGSQNFTVEIEEGQWVPPEGPFRTRTPDRATWWHCFDCAYEGTTELVYDMKGFEIHNG